MPNWCLIQLIREKGKGKLDGLIGRKVVLKFGKASFTGKVVRPHGKNDVFLVKFRRGVPGQAIGTRAELPI